MRFAIRLIARRVSGGQILCEAVAHDDPTHVKLASGEVVPVESVASCDADDERESDLVQMSNIDTPNILHTLRARHASAEVYTNVGQKGCAAKGSRGRSSLVVAACLPSAAAPLPSAAWPGAIKRAHPCL